MPRRALRKIDPALDLSPRWKRFEDLPCPWDAAALFGRTAPLEVEVGTGKGLFITGAAAAHPDVNFLGIEIALKYSRFAAARLAGRNLINAVMVNGDAQRVFRELLPDACLSAVHVYFPDPWWKARHKKRRVLNESFVRQVQRTLLPGGSLHVWTDVEEYFQAFHPLVSSHPALEELPPPTERAPQHDMDYHTSFERKKRKLGLAIYRAHWRRK